MHRLPDSLSKEQLREAVFTLSKFALIEEGITLAKQSPDLAELLLDMIAKDPDVILASAQTIAKRMETEPGKNYLLPDLTPEQYKLVVSLSPKKLH